MASCLVCTTRKLFLPSSTTTNNVCISIHRMLLSSLLSLQQNVLPYERNVYETSNVTKRELYNRTCASFGMLGWTLLLLLDNMYVARYITSLFQKVANIHT